MPLSENYTPQENPYQTWEKTFEQKINRSNLSKEEKEKAKMYMRDIARFKKSFSIGFHDISQLHDASAGFKGLKNFHFSDVDIQTTQAYIDKKYEQFWFEGVQDFNKKIKAKQYDYSTDIWLYNEYIRFLKERGYTIEVVSAEEIQEAKKQTRLNKIIDLKDDFEEGGIPPTDVWIHKRSDMIQEQKDNNEGIAYNIFGLREKLVGECQMTESEIDKITGITERTLRKYAPKYRKISEREIFKY